MKAYKVILITALLAGVTAVLHAEDGGKLKLVAIRHNYERSGESIVFVFQNPDGSPSNTVPKTEINYDENQPRLRLEFEGVSAGVDNLTIEGVAVSSIEAETVHDKTVVYIFLKKPVRYYAKQSPRSGTFILGVYDKNSGGFWVRVDSPNWRSAEAAYPFWEGLKTAAILTCLLQDESGDYFLSTVADNDTVDSAEKTRKAAQAVIDQVVEQDILQVAHPAASVNTVADSAGESEAAPPPADIAQKIDAAVANLASDPAVIDAGVRDKIISPAMREIIASYGEQAIPSLAVALTSKNETLRRSALLTLAAIGGRNVAQFLIGGLADSEPVVREEMLLSLENLPMTRAMLVALRGETGDGDKWARFFAARMLARAWVPDAVPILMQSMADEEVRDEAAAILQRYVSANISSEALAGLSPEETQAVINDLLAKWDADKEFLPPMPSPDIAADMLGKIFSRLYPSEQVTCYPDDATGRIMMKRSGADAAKPAGIVQFLSGSLDNDATREAIAIVGGEGDAPCAIAAIDGEDGSGDVMWVAPIEAGANAARAYLTDIDGDGVSEIILVTASGEGAAQTATLTMYRVGAAGFDKIFTTQSVREEPPQGSVGVGREVRSFMDFAGPASGPRDLLLKVRSKVGEGAEAGYSERVTVYKWKDNAYQESQEAPPSPANQTDAAQDGPPVQMGGSGPTQPSQNQENTTVGQPNPGNANPNPPNVNLGDGMALVAVKSDKKLYVYVNGELKKTYAAKFGAAQGDKEVEGDMKTPEGEFYICLKNPTSRYHLSMGLSYPDKEDAARGLEKKLITKEQYDAIAAAIDRKAQPPWKTPLGGEIFIHGDAESREDTHGCIALFNKDMEELYKMVPEGTKAIVKP